MKPYLLASTIAALLAGPSLAEPFIPPVGEGHAVPLTAEQRAGEAAAVSRKHDAILKASVDSARNAGQERLEFLLRELLKDGSAVEKASFASATGGRYNAPERIQNAAANSRFRLAFDRGIECRATGCRRWGTDKVCYDRSVCKVVCSGVAGGAGAAIGGPAGGAVGAGGVAACREVCELLPECRTVSVCVEQIWTGIGCF